VQQSVALAWKGATPFGMLVIAGPVTYVLGLVSWRLIESRALALKGRVVGTSRPRAVTSAAEAGG
jgi:peptidoglycan/LPS O-acetylase OafA/YrhL